MELEHGVGAKRLVVFDVEVGNCRDVELDCFVFDFAVK